MIYLTALVISVMLFSAGVVTGVFIMEWRNRGIEERMESLVLSAEDIAIQLAMMENGDCSLFPMFLDAVVKDMGRIEERIGEIENSNEINRFELDYLRKRYQILSLKYLLVLDRFGNCVGNRSVIIYFYDNGKSCKKCEDQGIILTHLKKKYGDGVLIFSFDHSMGLSSVSLLEKKYNVTSFPAVVVNGRTYGYMTLPELEGLIG